MLSLPLYPDSPTERTRWILARRGPKNNHPPRQPYGSFVEDEPGPDGTLWRCHTLLLTNRECAFRCLMCDLWQDTLDTTTESGAIAAQVSTLLPSSPPNPGRRVALKLYNAGSFFDPGQVPVEDYAAIADKARHFDRVIVESHTAFLKGKLAERVLAFRDAIAPAALEVAIGLETVQEVALEKLNKRMTVDDFRHAAAFLAQNQIALRVFLLVRPPFLTEEEGVEWGCRSLDVAHACGATFAALLPTRAGNGALEALAEQGHYAPPKLQSLEACLRYGQSLEGMMRVTADLWDIEPFVKNDDDRACVARITELNHNRGRT
ncbi:MAG: radical SAM protein [Armatimonadetes bacterium]|nr:radical SAM protein [Armatimonadota bacterium]